jgi:hypothetical protein
MIPDAEAILYEHLSAEPTVAAIVGERVSDSTPRSTTEPWLRITQLDAPGDVIDHLIAFYFQLDCYGGSDEGEAHSQASLLARTVRASLMGMPQTRPVSGVRIDGDSRYPDPDFEPARERRILTATVWAHA